MATSSGSCAVGATEARCLCGAYPLDPENYLFSPREVNLGFPASTNPSLDNGIYAGVDLGEGMPPRVPESYWLPCGGQNLLQIILG